MRKEYANYYRTLGVEPGVGWVQLRKAYKSLVNTWHPDRFQQDPRQRHLAEKKTKEIIQSFQELSEYYKEFGVLPHVTKAMGTPATDNLSSQSSPDIHTEHENQGTEVSTADLTQSHVHKGRRNKFNVRIMTATVLAGIAYLVWQSMPRGLSDNEPQLKSPVEHSVDKKISEDSGQGAPATGKYFTVGTPLGEVYGIQGVPTKTEQDVWHYGNSKVYFSKGKVLGWDEYPSNPLRAKITPGSEKTNTKLFDMGSSKDEVLAIQGRPDRDAGNMWEYGISRVYFEDDRVKGWDNSPFNPLKIRQ